MNTKNIIMGVLVAVTFFIAGMSYMLMQERQSTAVLSQPALQTGIATLHLHKGGDLKGGWDDITLDNSGNITRKQVNYRSGTSTELTTTGKIDTNSKKITIEATLTKFNASTIKSDPTPGPDMQQSILDYTTMSGQTHHLQCVASQSDCNKLTDALFADFHTILTHQGASNQ